MIHQLSLADLKLEQDNIGRVPARLAGHLCDQEGPESGNRSRCMECFTWDIFDGMHGKLCEMIIWMVEICVDSGLFNSCNCGTDPLEHRSRFEAMAENAKLKTGIRSIQLKR